MHFAVQASDRASALAKAEQLWNLGGSALGGLSADERDDVVNVFPYPDRDFDRLSDEGEAAAGTDPENPDTDGDGLSDGLEVEFGLDPLVAHPDEDGDGIDNLDEFARGTHPALPDTDGDRLLDGEEVSVHLTDPLEPDSDLGGVGDGREVLYDGTDPLAAGDDRAPVAINVSSSATEPALAAAAGGNLHAVWLEVRSGCRELFYSLVTPAGAPLIDDTQLTSGCHSGAEAPRIAADGHGRVHLLWADSEAIRHLALDPALDDLDGSPSTAETLLVIEPRALVPRPQQPEETWCGDSTPPVYRSEERSKAFVADALLRFALAADRLGQAHVVWQAEFYDPCGFGEVDSEVYYLQLAADGRPAVTERLMFQTLGSSAGPRGYPGVAVDGRGGVHLVWRAEDRALSGWGIFYAQLDAVDGAVRIAPTDLTPFREAAVGYPSVAVNDRGDRVTVAFEDQGEHGPEVFLRQIDPTRDDRDGDAADLVAVTVLGRTLLTPDDGNASTRPEVAVDDLGHLHLAHLELFDVPFTRFDRELIELAVYDPSGGLLLPPLAAGESLNPSGRAPRPAPAVSGTSSAVAWSPSGVWLRSFHPDADGDGLSYRLERLAGTDPADPDSDGDGLVDGFEAAHGFDPLTVGEATGDADGDGLDHLGEQGAGTDPQDSDGDGDRLADGDEVHLHGTDPRRYDSDGDRLADGDELIHGSDPLAADSDGDSLGDGFEVAFGLDPLLADDPVADPDGDGLSHLEEQDAGTDPHDPDTDGDGLGDGDELVHGTDPRRFDSDGDGLGDGDEVDLHGTDATHPDSDGDDLDDGVEVAAGFDPLLADDPYDDPDGDDFFHFEELQAGTDPFDPDTDDDGLRDGWEVWVYGTDPLLADSDGDRLADGEEVERYATDPNAADSDGDGGDDWQEVVLDGTDPTDSASRFALTRLTGGLRSDQAMPLLDAGGNLHVVWTDRREGNDEIFYTLLGPAGEVLIDDTRLTDDPASSKRPALAADSTGRIHVVWQDKRLGGESEVFHTAIDPTLDDRDGSPASDGLITVVAEQLLSTDDGEKSNHPRLVIDSQDRIHVVWSDDAAGDVRYVQLAADGTVAVPETLIFTGGEFRFRSLPTPAIDSGDDVHVVLNEQRGTATAEFFYLMLDGDSGAPLIDATLITPDDNLRARFPSLGVGPGDQVTVVFHDQRRRASGGEVEVFMLRLDPALDDRDGDAADPAVIQVLEDRVLSPDDGSKNNAPAAAVDGDGRAFVTYYEGYVGTEGRGDLRFLLADADGAALIPETRLSEERTAVTTTASTRANSAIDGLTAHVLWTDDRFGPREVVLRVLNPDVDVDGLTGLEEWLLGTDYLDADTDGGGRSDGEEVAAGTDPLDGLDDLP